MQSTDILGYIMPNWIEGATADEAWYNAAMGFHADKDYDVVDGRGGRTYERLHAGFSIENPRERWVVSRNPPLNIAFALAEILWILSGRNDARFLKYWNSKLPEYVGNSERLHGAYGHRLRQHLGIDQLERAYSAFSSAPSTRQVVIQIWDAKIDLPKPDGTPSSDDIPCNVMSLLKVRRNRLDWMQIVRSNDLFLGVPYNFAQFTFVQEVLAGWLGLELGSYTHVSDSLHVYEHDIELIQQTSKRELPITGDRYDLPKAESDRVLEDLTTRAEELIRDAMDIEGLLGLVHTAAIPEAYLNMLRILSAESARRRHWIDIAHKIAKECTNPVLLGMWERWFYHVNRI